MDLDDRLVELPDEVIEAFSRQTDFDLLEPVGGGGSRIVYKAQDRIRNNRLRAIKIYQEEPWGEQGGKLMANHSRDDLNRQEGTSLGDIKSPNVVRWFTGGEIAIDGKTWTYSVEEFLEGDNLDRRIPEFDEQDRSHVCTELLKGLGDMHALKYIHKDLKPENVMVSSEGPVVITDLQFATHEDDFEKWQSYYGARKFSAPDVLAGLVKADYGYDVYSMGATLYSLFTGDTDGLADINLLSEKEYGPAMREKISGIDHLKGRFYKFLEQSLEYHKEDRFKDGIEMEAAYRGIVDNYKRRNDWWLGLIGLGSVSVVLLLGSLRLFTAGYQNRAKFHPENSIVAFDEQTVMKPLVERLGRSFSPTSRLVEDSDLDINRPDRVVNSSDGKQKLLVKNIKENGSPSTKLTLHTPRYSSPISFIVPDISPNHPETFNVDGQILVSSRLPNGLEYRYAVWIEGHKENEKRYDEKIIGSRNSGYPLIQQGGTMKVFGGRPFCVLQALNTSRPLDIEGIFIDRTVPSVDRFSSHILRNIFFEVEGRYIDHFEMKNEKLPHNYIVRTYGFPQEQWILDGEDLGNHPKAYFEEEGMHTMEYIAKIGDREIRRLWEFKTIRPKDMRAELAVENLRVFSRKPEAFILYFDVVNSGFTTAEEFSWKTYVNGEEDRWSGKPVKPTGKWEAYTLKPGKKIGVNYLLNEFEDKKILGIEKGKKNFRISVNPDRSIDEPNYENNSGYLEFEVK